MKTRFSLKDLNSTLTLYFSWLEALTLEQRISFCVPGGDKEVLETSKMAVSMDNPQDPEFCAIESLAKHASTSTLYKKRRKPNRTWIYVRNHIRNSNLATRCSVSYAVMGFVLTVLSVHRVLSIYMSHRQWLNAPITYMQRTCPLTPYQPLQNHDYAGNICITTLTDSKSDSLLQRILRWRNFDGIIEQTWKNKADYAEKHGYRLYDGSSLIDTTRPPGWSKIRAVQHLMRENEGCDWVMWVDADTVFMNSDIEIESFLPHDPSKDMIVGSDNGGGYNSGVFVLRNSQWSRKFLDNWWNMNSFVRPPGFSLSGDNNAMKALLGNMPDFEQHVLVPARCTLNSFAQFLTRGESMSIMNSLNEQEWYQSEDFYHSGDFIAHTPGYDNKAECLRLLLKEAR